MRDLYHDLRPNADEEVAFVIVPAFDKGRFDRARRSADHHGLEAMAPGRHRAARLLVAPPPVSDEVQALPITRPIRRRGQAAM